MSRLPIGGGDFGFVEALMKRGFINIPRMMFDYWADLGLDYDTIGKVFAVFACVGGPAESAFDAFAISRRSLPRDFDQLRALLSELEAEEIVRCELVEENEVIFSFIPLFSRIRATWESYREQREEELAEAGPHPAVATAERLFGRPLSDREVRDVLDWVDTLHFELDMVEAVIQEGKRQGVLRMSYLNAIARGWAEAGISSPEEARAYVQDHQKSAVKYRNVTQTLGIMRPLTAPEQAILERWFNEWGFSEEVVLEACSRSSGSKNPLQYTNRVLEAWMGDGIRTTADVEQMVAQKKRATAAGDQSRPGRGRRQPVKSNVILQREKKDESYYDHIYKKFGE